MQGLLASVDNNQPKWKLEESLIGTNPGLGFRPLSEQTERGSVIEYDRKKHAESEYWISVLDSFLAGKLTDFGCGRSFHSFNMLCRLQSHRGSPDEALRF